MDQDKDSASDEAFAAGCDALEREDFAAAEEAFARAAEADPASAVTRYNLALSLQRQGFLLAAVAEYGRTLNRTRADPSPLGGGRPLAITALSGRMVHAKRATAALQAGAVRP